MSSSGTRPERGGLSDTGLAESILARRGRFLWWTTSLFGALERRGFHVHSWEELLARYISSAQDASVERQTIEPPAERWLTWLADHERVAVTGVPTQTVGDIKAIYGFVVEPAYRRNCNLVLVADRRLQELEPANFVEGEFGYAHTLEKLVHLAKRYEVGASSTAGVPPMTPIEELAHAAMNERGLRPHPQYGVGRYSLDFAFPEIGLGVECDGREWHDVSRDARRDDRLSRLGWKIVRFTGSEIFRDAATVADQVEAEIAVLRDDPDRLSPAALVPAGDAEARPSLWRRLVDFFLAFIGRKAKPHDPEPDPPPDEPPQGARSDHRDLDLDQLRAVSAHEGVSQVIAPAGSGKTTVLVERVAELIARGVPANRILCMTFNRHAAEELQSRIRSTTTSEVDSKTFHAVGLMICESEGLLRDEAEIIGSQLVPWKRLARAAMNSVGKEGVWIEPAEASDAISELKAGERLTPGEARRQAHGGQALTLATLYTLYEEHLAERGVNDFDDLVVLPVRLLQEDTVARERWQAKWQAVLVDEYQDIEPVQELLVRILAAPEDCLFCVGDEDQTIYAWRRASVERMIELDTAYPGLTRVALGRNYRCPPAVVEASRNLIECNRKRFPKTIEPGSFPEDGDGGSPRPVQALDYGETASAASDVAMKLAGLVRGKVVVLARTSRQLQAVAEACAGAHVLFDAPEKALTGGGAPATLDRYLRLFSDLRQATDPDISHVFRVPNRYLPDSVAGRVASVLRRGGSFLDAVGSLRGEDWRISKLEEGAEFFDSLVTEADDAQRFIRLLRIDGGLDAHFTEREQLAATEQTEVEALAAAESESTNMSVAAYSALREGRAEAMAAFLDRETGIELRTIHGAKGREWPLVIVFGVDDDQLPHARSLAEPAPRPPGEPTGTLAPNGHSGLEDERRLAYVAFTRAEEQLVLLCTGAPSRFLDEADIDLEAVGDAGAAWRPPKGDQAARGTRAPAF